MLVYFSYRPWYVFASDGKNDRCWIVLPVWDTFNIDIDCELVIFVLFLQPLPPFGDRQRVKCHLGHDESWFYRRERTHQQSKTAEKTKNPLSSHPWKIRFLDLGGTRTSSPLQRLQNSLLGFDQLLPPGTARPLRSQDQDHEIQRIPELLRTRIYSRCQQP